MIQNKHKSSVFTLWAISFAVYAAFALKAPASQLPPGPAAYKPELRMVVHQPAIALQWYYFEGANLFRVQAAKTPDFDDVFLDDTTPHHYYILADLPMDGTQIFWRVRAYNFALREAGADFWGITCLSEWSSPYSFFSGVSGTDDEKPDSNKPGIFDRLPGCDNKGGSDKGRVCWENYFLIFLATALLGQRRILCGKE